MLDLQYRKGREADKGRKGVEYRKGREAEEGRKGVEYRKEREAEEERKEEHKYSLKTYWLC